FILSFSVLLLESFCPCVSVEVLKLHAVFRFSFSFSSRLISSCCRLPASFPGSDEMEPQFTQYVYSITAVEKIQARADRGGGYLCLSCFCCTVHLCSVIMYCTVPLFLLIQSVQLWRMRDFHVFTIIRKRFVEVWAVRCGSAAGCAQAKTGFLMLFISQFLANNKSKVLWHQTFGQCGFL
ncbi:hypothetical protein B0T13DRAFT_517904, partial [Neurospora crassa]